MKNTKYLYHFLLLYINSTSVLQAQVHKPPLDTSAINNWENVAGNAAINNNGTYVGYQVYNAALTERTLYLKSIAGPWTKVIPYVLTWSFTEDNNRIIYLTKEGDMNLLRLGSDEIVRKPDVRSYKLFSYNKIPWLLYATSKSDLVVLNMKTNRSSVFDSVNNYIVSESQRRLILQKDKGSLKAIYFVEFKNLERHFVCENREIDNLTIDRDANQLAFLSGGNVYYTKLATEISALTILDTKENIDRNLTIARLERFSHDGKNLFIRLQNIHEDSKKNPSAVEVWSYHDPYLKSFDRSSNHGRSFLFQLTLKDKSITRIENENETATFLNSENDNYIQIDYLPGDINEAHWNENGRHKFSLYNTITRKRSLLNYQPISSSPDSRYMVLWDSTYTEFKVCNLTDNRIKTLTKSVSSILNQKDVPSYDYKGWTFAGWLGKNSMLLYDLHDIWIFKPDLFEKPINITNGYGRKHNVSLRLAARGRGLFETNPFESSDLQILLGFENETKRNGFYRLTDGYAQDPKIICLEDAFFGYPGHIMLSTTPPVKARFADTWVVSKETAESSRNYFITKDFKKFIPLSSVHPEQRYNWLRSELLTYDTRSGRQINGILYKPENFDSTKQYPIVIYYYEVSSDKLNVNLTPALTKGGLNIPWFVSRGYLVCLTDVTFIKGKTGESALNAVHGAADYLSKLSFVDSTRMGIYGHSFGGFQTNYIISHTNRFACAVAACATSDLISAYNSVMLELGSNYSGIAVEAGQMRIGYNLWEKPEVFLENSPILKADHVTTPVLTLANDKDGVINYSQGIEWFVALRRLGKKVWMLHYPGEYHELTKKANQLDYTNKLEGFFDYYLKSEKKPRWMNSEEESSSSKSSKQLSRN